jgi:hypothetical protein
MKPAAKATLFAAFIALAGNVWATGLATCDSGPEENWRPSEELVKLLIEKGWEVRRVKVDGGCYEVYALDENGERVEAYYHPVTFEPVAIEKEEAE